MTDTPQGVASTITTSGTSGIQTAAATAEKVVEAIAKVEGPILTGVSIFVPGAAAITVPLETILPLIIPDIEKALNDVAAGTYGDLWEVCKQFVDHIKVGAPNSPILSQVKAVIAAGSPKPDMPPAPSA
jgi:hypothetical protein